MADIGNTGRRTAGPDAGRQAGGGSSGGVLETAQGAAEGLASSVAGTAQGAWESTKEGTQRAASAVANTAGDAWGELAACLRRYPAATFLAGVAAGFLLAAAWTNLSWQPDVARGLSRSGRQPEHPYGT